MKLCMTKSNWNIIPALAPSAYEAEKVNLAHQPAFSFGSRHEEKIKTDIPGE